MVLEIISSEQILFKGEVESVTLPGAKGSFTVLENHASLISTLDAGTIEMCIRDSILADEIIFIAPVIFSEEATEPILPFKSRIDAIVYALNRLATSSATSVMRAAILSSRCPARNSLSLIHIYYPCRSLQRNVRDGKSSQIYACDPYHVPYRMRRLRFRLY